MKLDIDKVLGWDFVVTINRRDYFTRSLELEEILAIQHIGEEKDEKLKEQTMRTLARSMLIDPPDKMSLRQCESIIIGCMEYLKAFKKKEQSIVARIRAAMVMDPMELESGSSTAQ